MFPNEEPLSASTIYRYIKKKKFPDITAKRNLRRKGKRLYSRNTNCNTIHPDRIIPEWTDEIKSRTRIGDWEGDTVYGAVGKGLIVTLVDRKSRFLCAGLLNSRNADETQAVIVKLLADKPVKSVSLDNGSEFAKFRELEKISMLLFTLLNLTSLGSAALMKTLMTFYAFSSQKVLISIV